MADVLPEGVYRGEELFAGGSCLVWVRKDAKNFSVLVSPANRQDGEMNANFMVGLNEELYCFEPGTFLCNPSYMTKSQWVRQIEVKTRVRGERVVKVEVYTKDGREHSMGGCVLPARSK